MYRVFVNYGRYARPTIIPNTIPNIGVSEYRLGVMLGLMVGIVLGVNEITES